MFCSSALRRTSLCTLHNCYVWCWLLNVTEIVSGSSSAHTSRVLFLDGIQAGCWVRSFQSGLVSVLFSSVQQYVCLLHIKSLSIGTTYIQPLGSGIFHDRVLPPKLHSSFYASPQPGLPNKSQERLNQTAHNRTLRRLSMSSRSAWAHMFQNNEYINIVDNIKFKNSLIQFTLIGILFL